MGSVKMLAIQDAAGRRAVRHDNDQIHHRRRVVDNGCGLCRRGAGGSRCE